MKIKIALITGVAALLATVSQASNYNQPETASTSPPDAINWAVQQWNHPDAFGSFSQSSGSTTTVDGTNSTPWYVELFGGIGASIEAGVTNLAIEPFAICSLNAPKPVERFGGGLALFYNLNNYVAPGAAFVYLGHASIFNGTVTLRLPFQPLPTVAPDLWLTPNVVAGAESGIGGLGNENGTIGVVSGAGVSLSFGHLFGGQFNVGFEAVNRTSAGPYSGWAAQPFGGWSKAF